MFLLPADEYEVLKNFWVESLKIFENNDNGRLLWIVFDGRTSLFSRTDSVGFLKHKEEKVFTGDQTQ